MNIYKTVPQSLAYGCGWQAAGGENLVYRTQTNS